jgi:hypothetical protein
MQDQRLTEKLKNVSNYSELLGVALWWIAENNFDSFVCGTIFSDGTDKIAENIRKLENQINQLEKQGNRVFNQIHFLDINLAQETKIDHFETRIKFDEFYQPLFTSGCIKKVFMMPDWERSQGCSWEHEFAKNSNVEIIYLK